MSSQCTTQESHESLRTCAQGVQKPFHTCSIEKMLAFANSSRQKLELLSLPQEGSFGVLPVDLRGKLRLPHNEGPPTHGPHPAKFQWMNHDGTVSSSRRVLLPIVLNSSAKPGRGT